MGDLIQFLPRARNERRALARKREHELERMQNNGWIRQCPPSITNPVEMLEHFLVLAKADQIMFLAVHVEGQDQHGDGFCVHAEVNLITEEEFRASEGDDAIDLEEDLPKEPA